MTSPTRLACPAAFFLAWCSPASASTWFVRADAAPGGDGTSWASAFDSLQTALGVALHEDQVWVKAGTYLPGTQASPRTVTFEMRNRIEVYGGFAGTETLLSQRDWLANPTVLSGDLLQDDGPDFANRGDNAYHVVDAMSVHPSSLLDGFVVRGGNANGSVGYQHLGGGILGADATLRNLTVVDNSAGSGGGLYVAEGFSPIPPIEGCVFRGNRATTGGGGIVCYHPGLALRRCVIAGNAAGQGGGLHVYIFENSGVGLLENCLVVGNSGTGIRSEFLPLVIKNTTIAFNHSPGPHAGVWAVPGPTFTATLRNSIVWGNTADAGATTYAENLGGFVDVVVTAVEGGAGPLDADPRWEDPLGPDGVAGTADDDLGLSCTSPYIDRGDNALSAGIATDLAGDPRFADDPATPDQGAGTAPIVDLGPYEFVCACDEIASYCTALPNSSGLPASIGASGSTSLFANALVLHATNGPPLKNGLFFYGATQASVPWGDGIRCVGGSLFRLPVVTLDASGAVAFPLDVTQHPASGGPGAILEGSTWNFQLYFRDPTGGPAGWNTTDAISIAFCR